MRQFILIAALAAALFITGSGCSGVIMSAEYSDWLDETVARSKVTAEQAQAGLLTEDQKTIALVAQYEAWIELQNARDGKEPTTDE